MVHAPGHRRGEPCVHPRTYACSWPDEDEHRPEDIPRFRPLRRSVCLRSGVIALPVDRAKDDVDRADQGDGVGQHGPLGYVGQHLEVDEVWRADTHTVGIEVPSETM